MGTRLNGWYRNNMSRKVTVRLTTLKGTWRVGIVVHNYVVYPLLLLLLRFLTTLRVCNRTLKSVICLQVHCCFTSTEAIRTIGDGEPRTPTSTFTQLLNSASALLPQCLLGHNTLDHHIWLSSGLISSLFCHTTLT